MPFVINDKFVFQCLLFKVLSEHISLVDIPNVVFLIVMRRKGSMLALEWDINKICLMRNDDVVNVKSVDITLTEIKSLTRI